MLPLWRSFAEPSEIAAAWATAKETLQKDPSADWRFWITWFERVRDGRNIHAADLAKVLDTFTREEIEGDPAAVMDRFDPILALYDRKTSTEVSDTDPKRTTLSEASYFDFIEINRQMKAVGFPSDASAFPDDAARQAFADAVKDLKADLYDWTDYAAAHLKGRNAPVSVVSAVHVLMDQLDGHGKGDGLSLRRLISVGSDVRRLANVDEGRAALGQELSEMLDERLDDYSEIVRSHLGEVLAVLDVLRSLDLGNMDSVQVLSQIKAGVARVHTVSDADILPPDQRTQAILNDMMVELEDVESSIGEALTDRRRELLRKRLAEKIGGFSATYGRLVEMGSEAAHSNAKRFDEAVKWYKRWKTIEQIMDWWNNFGGGPGL
mmetsp:Transcript_29190/g.56411  ORF Transcript_29190/g.56411 Transcript_29190/m.56411 type:complete len:379 (+) Transcript_29190:4768-5904(+)